MQITIAGMYLMNFMKTQQIFENCPSILRKTCLLSNNQIRIAAPHLEIGFGHGWANFNTQSVHTLSLSRFVASRSSGNHDSWHGFSDFYETSSDFMNSFNRFCEKGAS
jgi:hypothetical protein